MLAFVGQCLVIERCITASFSGNLYQTSWNLLHNTLGLEIEAKQLTFAQITIRGVIVFVAALIMMRIWRSACPLTQNRLRHDLDRPPWIGWHASLERRSDAFAAGSESPRRNNTPERVIPRFPLAIYFVQLAFVRSRKSRIRSCAIFTSLY